MNRPTPPRKTLRPLLAGSKEKDDPRLEVVGVLLSRLGDQRMGEAGVVAAVVEVVADAER